MGQVLWPQILELELAQNAARVRKFKQDEKYCIYCNSDESSCNAARYFSPHSTSVDVRAGPRSFLEMASFALTSASAQTRSP